VWRATHRPVGSATYDRNVQHEGELYGERQRLKAQDELLAAGLLEWTDRVDRDRDLRIKLNRAWDDVTGYWDLRNDVDTLEAFIRDRTLDSIAASVEPRLMQPPDSGRPVIDATNDELLSLIEAEHEALTWLAAKPDVARPGYAGMSPRWREIVNAAPEKFREKVNKLLRSHLIALQLEHNSCLVPVQSQEMHAEVVEPTLRLLHSQPQFADAETRYHDALRELRNGYPGDAITDAAAALEHMLEALGCTGNALGDLLKSARNRGLVKGKDTPLTEAIGRTADWVATQRNQGEAHRGGSGIDMSDAWMVVHVVGALIIRLSESSPSSRTQGGS
jgi:hypothetical protein